MLAKLRNNFIAGLAVILPIVVTVIFLRFLLSIFNNILFNPVMKSFRPYLIEPFSVYVAKAIVLLSVIILIILIGLATKILLLKKLFSVGEKIFYKVPLINKVYLATKEIGNAFLGQRRGVFQRVIILEYPRNGIYSVGFVTSKSRGEIQSKVHTELVNVFVPTTPNPTSGVFLLVPKDQTIPLEMSVEEGLKLVVSGGAVVPPEHHKKLKE